MVIFFVHVYMNVKVESDYFVKSLNRSNLIICILKDFEIVEL